MTAINFPASPSVDDTHVVGDITWRWNGSSWVSSSTFNGRMPAGTTAQRPSEPKIGQIRYNTDIDAFEGYDASGWRPFYGTIVATPEGVSPEPDEQIPADQTFELVANPYVNLLGIDHASSDWQISDDPAFGTTEVNISEDTSNLTSYEVDGGISTEDTFYWRVRYRDSEGNVSDWSTPIEFQNIILPPDTLGQSYNGGIYMGTIAAAGTCYYLIVAPNATGCAQACQWKTTRTATAGTGSLTDGYANTYGPMDNADHPAGNWCATRTINGFSDWYLPAIDEIETFYDNGATSNNESVIGAGEAFGAGFYWSSTELSADSACLWLFTFGGKYSACKTSSYTVRAVRREPI
jgi:hypothetical protein